MEPARTQPQSDSPPQQGADKIVAPPARDPTVRFTIVALGAFGLAAWCAYDVFVMGKHPYGSGVNEFLPWLANWGSIVVMPLVGIAMLAWILRVVRRPAEADAQGVGFVGKPKVAWDRIERIDAPRLKDKGILDLYYDGGRKLTLDSWKLDNFKALVAYIERHLPADVKRT